MEQNQTLVIFFEEKEIRRIWHEEEWWFSIVDVIEALTKSKRPRKYWSDLKRKLANEGFQSSENIGQLRIESSDGKKYKTDVANTEGMFRIIQSISSPNAEPFKRWLAEVAYDRIQEIQDPSLAAERARQYYLDQGYSEDWIAKRLQSIEIRGKLTDAWQNRGVKKGLEYSILTAEVSKGTFGLTPSQHRELKNLKRENLRDHMTDLELIFTMLGETATRNEAMGQDAKGFEENRNAAIEGGAAAGEARTAFEQRTNQKVVSDKNFKAQIAEAKRLKKLAAKKQSDKK
ncbi:MAG: Bro-N domain-containing protein [Saprospiraceae bacterium]